MIQVVIVGAGQGGYRLIDALANHQAIHLQAVVDLNKDAPGMSLARTYGIATLKDYAPLFKNTPPPDLVLEVTGNPTVYTALVHQAPTGTAVISGTALHFFMLLIEDKMTLIKDLRENLRSVTELQRVVSEVTSLREVKTLLEAVIESTQDAISVVDENGRGILINPAYTRITGLTPEQVIDQPAEVDIAEGESMHMQVLRTQQPVRAVHMRLGPKRREVLVDVAPIVVGGKLKGSVGVIHDVSEIRRLTEELQRANRYIRSLQAKYTFDDILGHSTSLLLAVEQARQAAQTPATVLLRGESGTGKELFAHAIHNASPRHFNSFVRVNCAALSESLLESELFGYEDGAFTGARRGGKKGLFEEASGGTLFLDEIGEMSPATQAKLLRTLQEHEIVRVGGTQPVSIHVRVIAATHVNLEQAVAAGRFREDLYYRLNVFPIVIPPLRYHKEDIPELTQYIVYRHNQAYGRNVQKVAEDTLETLESYSWPGNVRELENTIGRAMIHMDFREQVLRAHNLPLLRLPQSHPSGLPQTPANIRSLADTLREAERAAIQQALHGVQGNKTEAAKRLGISLRSLYYKLEQHGLTKLTDASELQ